MLPALLTYTSWLLPGLLLITAGYLLARPVPEPLLRITLLILGFILIRDAMTPAGFWQFGAAGGVPWLRFTEDWAVLIVFAVGTLALTTAVLWRNPDLRALVWWGRPDLPTLGLGLGAAVLIAAPVLLLSTTSPLAERGGPVPVTLLPVLAAFALAGNLAEEVLFRGFLQGRLAQLVSAVRAALLSGVLFAVCHAYLATTVTDVGAPLLLFTLYEGLVCAFLRTYRGVIPAALAHGGAIFLLASGLL